MVYVHAANEAILREQVHLCVCGFEMKYYHFISNCPTITVFVPFSKLTGIDKLDNTGWIVDYFN